MINLNQAIFTLISGATYTLVNNRIYPLQAPENTPLPFIGFERSSTVNWTRDACTYDSVVTIYILSADYGTGITIGGKLIDALSRVGGVYAGINIKDIYLTSIEETVTDQIFTQKLEFTVHSVV